jgi:AcrR family transcriptional regulator
MTVGDRDADSPPQKRGERITAAVVRQRMLEAGRDVALESGAALAIEDLRLEDVIQRARVPRSSVYRLWRFKEDFADDLLCYLAGPGYFASDDLFDPETFDVVKKTIADNRDMLATIEGRRAVMCEATRRAVGRNFAAFADNRTWRLHMALMATVGSTRKGDVQQRIAAELEKAQTRSRTAIVDLFGYLKDVLGLQLRDPARTIDHFALAGGMLVQGLALRNVLTAGAKDNPSAEITGQLLNTTVPGPGLNGEAAEWTLAAVAYQGLIDAFMELDPDFRPHPA